ncbi:5-formyltetrahydrofolate cyclo-ligase [Kaistia soli DSM 19436]|uniref:5-formyltetrahydrofolate cyclo-ligase n=1 Tax=Kaistia soli DSM 19436 TaxID=1122133 RepID=A0A1M5G4C0_9HYPH|nr:5-formyltetrahydrofolate cyclo-ligase [Kaistia soli]SHF98558.1 5-formyltetrahydrofolate cyclo-ligase [Kaistia soli DSM 19436]
MSRARIVRERIWEKLRPVAKPDSRFHLNFSEVIPDFEGSESATDRLVAQPFYQKGSYAFVTPDNGLVDLRRRMLEAGKTLVVSTYGIYRGFYLLEPSMVPPGQALFAAWLDGLEHFGRPISLAEIAKRGRFDFMVTGASAVSLDGVRFGKGHGFFDLEWGMFTEVGIVDEATPVAAMVHDVQVVEEKLHPSETDILVDTIATPTRFLEVKRATRPRGIRWDMLSAEQIAATPPLLELQRMKALATPA